MTSKHRLSATAIDEALAKSVLAAFPPTLRETLTQDAIQVDLPAGTTLYHEEDEPRCGLVITGLIRVYMTSPDGRQVTVRYARAGNLLGIAAIVGVSLSSIPAFPRTRMVRSSSRPICFWSSGRRGFASRRSRKSARTCARGASGPTTSAGSS